MNVYGQRTRGDVHGEAQYVVAHSFESGKEKDKGKRHGDAGAGRVRVRSARPWGLAPVHKRLGSSSHCTPVSSCRDAADGMHAGEPLLVK